MNKKDKPNILVLMSDQHSKRFLGCYGNTIVRTPHLDRLASEGMRFTNAYCPAPVGVPSRMSFLTSRMPSRNRVWNDSHILSSGIPTWAHVLGVGGYETALVGRMHFRGADQRHGFAMRPIGEFCAGHPGAAERGAQRYAHFPRETEMATRVSLDVAGTGRTAVQWMDDQVTKTACALLKTRAVLASERPFATLVGFWLPHPPFIVPKELFEYYLARVDVPVVEKRQPAVIRKARTRAYVAPGELQEERVRVCRAAYYALCELMDRNIGRILDCLDETGLADNTVVVYCSDHGEMAGEHGLFWKNNYYEATVGVPLIARGPGRIAAGGTDADIVNLIDIGPTLCEMGGADMEWDTDGRSLAKLLGGTAPKGWAQETISEFGGRTARASRMIRAGNLKFWVEFENGKETDRVLFDLSADPTENRDLSKDPTQRATIAALEKRLLAGWDPVSVCRATKEASDNCGVLSAWGSAVNPTSEDAVEFPDSEMEADFEKV